MASRKPDGVPGGGKFEEEPDEGDALARPAIDAKDMAKAIKPGEAFPGGMGALAILEGRGEKTANVCNLSLRQIRFDRLHGPQPDGKKGIVQVTLQPFEVIELPLEEAKRLMFHQEQAPAPKPGHRSRRPRPTLVVVGIFPGDCGGKRKFSVQVETRPGTFAPKSFRTCPFHGCAFGDHADNAFSVWQAQHFMRSLGTPDAIDRFAEGFDLRSDTTALAMFETKRRRELSKKQRMEAAQSAGALEAVN